MTFNPSVPLTTQSPSLFPTQNQTNMSRLKTIVAVDHQFNDTAASNDGFHNVVHLTQQAPSGTDSVGRLYVKQSGTGSKMHLFYMDDTAVNSLNYQITPTMPIRAAVNFNGTGAVGAQTMRSQYNITSVVKTGTGLYTVNFTTAMPDDTYIVQVTGMSQSVAIGSILIGTVLGHTVADYALSVTSTFVKLSFVTQSGSLSDPTMGNVTIFSVT